MFFMKHFKVTYFLAYMCSLPSPKKNEKKKQTKQQNKQKSNKTKHQACLKCWSKEHRSQKMTKTLKEIITLMSLEYEEFRGAFILQPCFYPSLQNTAPNQHLFHTDG